MKDGKKAVASRIVNESFNIIHSQGYSADKTLLQAVANAAPPVVMRSQKRGASRIRVPFPLMEAQRNNLALRNIVWSARETKVKRDFSEKLAKELMEASLNKGKAVEKKNTIMKEAEENKGNIYHRWS
eukprot:snap_masked-scaffold_7-processed-gene-6.34-mRNA-1 protein AED:1.00 eAED:1.00 QI:0/-1/0/0/-1/1/1/0/127